jgi:RNA polymerase sigma-70 factor (ECF subfamily)
MHTIVVDDRTCRGRSAESSTDMTHDTEGALDRSIIAGALRRLPLAYRQILLETITRRNTLPVTATRLGITAGTVRSRLHHATHELRRELDIGRVAQTGQ